MQEPNKIRLPKQPVEKWEQEIKYLDTGKIGSDGGDKL